MNSLSIFGTSSDAGKSTLAFAITYLLHHRGVKVSPFKAQNISNNSQVTDDGGEIAIPQHFSAESIGLKTTSLMNPILIKSGEHMILNGSSVKSQDTLNIEELKVHVKKAFSTLLKNYDCVVAEGAGSPVELNLINKDLSNIYVANEFNTKIVLVADIQKGGVFASIYGVYNLLPKKLRKNVIGVIINKFHGDTSFFDEGVSIIEKEFKIPVLGVVPFQPFNLGFEDSESLTNYVQNNTNTIIKVGVIQLPHMSNFTDFEPLIADKELEIIFTKSPNELQLCDLIIVPGTKKVVADLEWLREKGFESILKLNKKTILAICGAYEMMFENILDPDEVESEQMKVQGFSRFKGNAIFQTNKIVQKGSYNLFGAIVDAYEIHNATTKKGAKKKKNLYGTFLHGFFEDDIFRYRFFSEINPLYKGYNFKEYKKETIKKFTQHIEKNIDIKTIHKALDANF